MGLQLDNRKKGKELYQPYCEKKNDPDPLHCLPKIECETNSGAIKGVDKGINAMNTNREVNQTVKWSAKVLNIYLSMSPTHRMGPTQGQRKLTKVGCKLMLDEINLITRDITEQ